MEPTISGPEAAAAAAPAKRGVKRARKQDPPPAETNAEGAAAAAAVPQKKQAPKSAKSNETAAAASSNVPGEENNGSPLETGTWLVVAKAVRAALKATPTPMHCGADALPALNVKVQETINEAIARALANGRKTIKASDF
jgi:hypothetical protein